MKVKKKTLLLLASIIWTIAGINILHIGLSTYRNYLTVLNLFLSLLVFLFFWFIVFHKLTIKHTHRIKSYQEDLHFFLKFFDIKSFIIMAVMIVLGISIRKFNLLPDVFIAVFYTGLGSALFMAGLLFAKNYFKYNLT